MGEITHLLERRLPLRLRLLFGKIGEVADQIGVNVYLVGGLPRDLLLGQPNLDVDIVVEGDGIAFAKEFAAREGGLAKAHKRFQTAIVVLPDGLKIDVATARVEQYECPAALPVVESSGIKQDLYRRDFTLNSMAIQLNRASYGRLVDYFGGRHDLESGMIRVLHDFSFVDDPMRIIRAVRFEQRYGFTIDEKTEHLLRDAVRAGLLDKVSSERIGKEIALILKEQNPLPPILRLSQLGVLESIHPLLQVGPVTERLFSRIGETLPRFDLTPPVENWIVYLLGLTYLLAPKAKRRVEDRLRLSKKARECISELESVEEKIQAELVRSDEIKPSQIYFSLRGLSWEVLLFIMAYSEKEVVRQRISLYLDRLKAVKTEISGRELKGIGVPSGPVFRQILDEVLAARLDGQVGSKEEELKLVREILLSR